MLIEEIRPFVRFVRTLDIDKEIHWGASVPRDCRLFYTEQGKGVISTDRKEFYMEQGSILIIPAGYVYSLVPSNVTYLAVNFDYTWKNSKLNYPVPPLIIRKGDRGELIENVIFQDATELNDCMYYPNGCTYGTLLHRMLEEYTQKPPFFQVSISAILCSLIIDIVRKYRTDTVYSGNVDLEGIVAYIQQNYTRKLTNRDIAEKFHFHSTYISDVFKKVYGKSLHQYVMEYRIFAAISLLEESQLSVEEVAGAVGFYDSSYFSRYFKKITGVSPKQYLR